MPDLATPDRDALKAALTEALRENRDWFREVVQEALLEAAHAEARREDDLRSAHAERQRHFPLPTGRA